MGVFPYECPGRCARYHEASEEIGRHCEGGQDCWEDQCYVQRGEWEKGLYEGYGYVVIRVAFFLHLV